MNSDFTKNSAEAKILYLNADYEIEKAGAFVRCAVTSEPIAIDDLKYWSVARQEAYVDVDASLKAELETRE